MRPFDLVIFDCDGVLVDSEPLSIAGLVEVLGETGYALSESDAYRRFLGRSSTAIFGEIAGEADHLSPDRLAARFQARVMETFASELRPIPGIVAVLEALRVPFCVASSSTPERVRLALQVCGLARFFGERVFTSAMVAHAKPAPDLFLHAAAEMGVEPSQTLVIEDSDNGIRAAQGAGMTVWHFQGGSHFGEGRVDRATDLGADRVFGDMRDVAAALRTLFGAPAPPALALG